MKYLLSLSLISLLLGCSATNSAPGTKAAQEKLPQSPTQPKLTEPKAASKDTRSDAPRRTIAKQLQIITFADSSRAMCNRYVRTLYADLGNVFSHKKTLLNLTESEKEQGSKNLRESYDKHFQRAAQFKIKQPNFELYAKTLATELPRLSANCIATTKKSAATMIERIKASELSQVQVSQEHYQPKFALFESSYNLEQIEYANSLFAPKRFVRYQHLFYQIVTDILQWQKTQDNLTKHSLLVEIKEKRALLVALKKSVEKDFNMVSGLQFGLAISNKKYGYDEAENKKFKHHLSQLQQHFNDLLEPSFQQLQSLLNIVTNEQFDEVKYVTAMVHLDTATSTAERSLPKLRLLLVKQTAQVLMKLQQSQKKT